MDVPPDFVLTRIGANFVGALETPEQERHRFTAFARFLDENNLSTRRLLESDGQVAPDFSLLRRDLTDEGFAFLKLAYARWLAAVDRTKKPENTLILRRSLAKLRAAE